MKTICGTVAVFLLLFTAVSLFSMGTGPVRIYDSTVRWKHFDYRLTSFYHITEYHPDRIVETNFRVKIIENDHLRVTLLPEYGGRILSLIYKPLNKELLYQNPVGSVFGIKEKSFFYDHLMVYGGIFPTFPEPEHGKSWMHPWDFRVLSQSPDEVTVEMTFRDWIPFIANTPYKFRYGQTGLICAATVTLRRDSSALELGIRLSNRYPGELDYEYWTCMTLAPGSEPGQTFSPPSTEIILPDQKVFLKDDWWPWMAAVAGAKFHRKHVTDFGKLAVYKNWQDMGILYAYPGVNRDWYGVINQDNQIGILRHADRKKTPGLKVWTWGFVDNDPRTYRNGQNPKRPYIELWAGVSRQFFSNDVIRGHETKQWTETYAPTVGLTNWRSVTTEAAFDQSVQKRPGGVWLLSGQVFSFRPNRKETLRLELSNGTGNRLLTEKTWKASPTGPLTVQYELGAEEVTSLTNRFILRLLDESGRELGSSTLSI